MCVYVCAKSGVHEPQQRSGWGSYAPGIQWVIECVRVCTGSRLQEPTHI